MKKMCFVAFLLFTIPITQMAQNKTGIHFMTNLSWSAALAKAKAERKCIFIDVYTTWCVPCKMMDSEIYPAPELGNLFDEGFISLKVQMDVTDKDNDYIKSWYNDAKTIEKTAKIEAYPSLLFYSPDGELVFKAIGYKNIGALTRIAKFALNPIQGQRFKKQLLDYQNGIKDYSNMADLAANAKEYLGDNKLALSIAKDYKDNYLDKLSSSEFLKPANLKFIDENGGPDLVYSKDKYFKACYKRPEFIDSLFGRGYADYYVKSVINREEILSKLYIDNKPKNGAPKWLDMYASIKAKYPKLDVEKLILLSKIDYYRRVENWDVYSRLKSLEIKRYPKKASEMGIYDNLNHFAWDAFLHSSDSSSLKRALDWSELSIQLEESTYLKAQYTDTKANLYYKLGRIALGITWEEKAIELIEVGHKKDTNLPLSIANDFKKNLGLMKGKLPTWPAGFN